MSIRYIHLLLVLFFTGLAGCTSLDRNVPRPHSFAYMQPQTSPLWAPWAEKFEQTPHESGFHLLASGIDALAARLALIESAEHTLDVQYYMIHPDESGRLLIEHIVSAAERGVRVRVIIDDLYAIGFDEEIATLSWHPKIDIRIFNPRYERQNVLIRGIENVMNISRINTRMHNKLMVADNAAMIMGGRNLGDEYFDLDPDMNFRDLDVLIFGPLVRDSSAIFDSYWNSDVVLPISARKDIRPTENDYRNLRKRLIAHRENLNGSKYQEALENSTLIKEIREGTIHLDFAHGIVFADKPYKFELGTRKPEPSLLISQLQRTMPIPEREVLASSPYFIPGRNGVSVLTTLANMGVRVHILTNSYAANDVGAVHSAYAPYRRALLHNGVTISELKKVGETPHDDMAFDSSDASLHTKAFVIDREIVFIGSLNLDPRSVIHNTETGVLIYCPDIAVQVADLIETASSKRYSYQLSLDPKNPRRILWTTAENGEVTTTHRETGMTLLTRLSHFLLRLLPIEDQL